MSLRRSIIFLLRWHRRIALVAALFLVVLSITGILLNHTSEFGFDKSQINSSLAASWYGVEQPIPIGFEVNRDWLTHDGVQSLYLNRDKITDCTPPLYGAVPYQQGLLALCHQELLMISADGALLERISPVYGLPQGSSAVAINQDQLLMKAGPNTYLVDIDSLQWAQQQPLKEEIDWAIPASLPADLIAHLESSNPGISVERLLLDLHSGRLFGPVGVYFMDLMGLFFVLLSVSGICAWIKYLKLKKSMADKEVGSR